MVEAPMKASDPDCAAEDGFSIVVAYERNNGIGYKGTLPWNIPEDLKYFKKLTSSVSRPGQQNAVIMGRVTWESIPEKYRPLPGRINIVISRTMESPVEDGNTYSVAGDLDSALQLAKMKSAEYTFVIGGSSIYSLALQHEQCLGLHVTEVQANMDCDTFFPERPKQFKLWSQSSTIRHGDYKIQFKCYVRCVSMVQCNNGVTLANYTPQCSTEYRGRGALKLPPGMNTKHEECQYLDLIEEVMECGNEKGDRTGTGTFSVFGRVMRFNLRETFPLLTTKRVFWRGVAEEMLWFISGSTNARVLSDKGIHIWDGNGSREYLDSIGLTEREAMDLGPVYGFQWRHFGAEYSTMHDDYSSRGIDQLKEVIHKIKTNPNDRRIIMTAWNPAALAKMALPPCHMFCQFYVADGEVSCMMNQRSCDLGLGVPFNIASYALLTRLVAQVCGLQPGDFIHVLGDAHVYSSHVEPLREQLTNHPRPLPQLHINPNVLNIDDFHYDDFELIDYNPHKKIPMKMAV